MVYETYTPMYSEIFQKVHGAKNKESKIKVLHIISNLNNESQKIFNNILELMVP